MTPAAHTALDHLRDPVGFSWLIVPLAVLVLYAYITEWSAGRRAVVMGGLAFLLADVFNELWNSAFFHATGRAPVWGATGASSFQILVGWNVEILVMFAVLGLGAAKLLPADREARVAGIRLRWGYVGTCAALAVGVEMVLNAVGVLTWDWPWWSVRVPVLIWLVGYCPFFAACAWVHDLPTQRARVAAVGAMAALDGVLALGLGLAGWL